MDELKASFYSQITAFHDFESVLDDRFYKDVPSDWVVVLADVKGSTKAIEQGRYKQVNMIGAASITCVLNCIKDIEIPFVFGGDGATLIIPPESVPSVSAQLRGLQSLAKREFEMELRVGLVPMEILLSQNYKLKVAKYELSPGNNLAQFRGGALSHAEEMVKKKLPGAILLEASTDADVPDLEGLSCRLSPLHAKRDRILSLICKLREGDRGESTLQNIMIELKTILGDNFKSASPVNIGSLKWQWLPARWRDEVHLRKGRASFLGSVFQVLFRILLANMSLKLNIPLGPFKPQKYKEELVLNSDFKKFDEMLRMVVDCTEAQILAIENLLKSYYDQKKIFFGIHKSSEALMTCMVFSASQNQHIHFIDGSHGGYAFAALSLKQQVNLVNIDK